MEKINEPTGEEQPLPGHDLPTHSEDGVDLTLIRWMLAMTPAERLKTLEDHMRGIWRLTRRARSRT